MAPLGVLIPYFFVLFLFFFKKKKTFIFLPAQNFLSFLIQLPDFSFKFIFKF